METIKVSSSSCPNNVAGAIASMIRNSSKLQIQVIGAAALNQAVKAMLLLGVILFLQVMRLSVSLLFMI